MSAERCVCRQIERGTPTGEGHQFCPVHMSEEEDFQMSMSVFPPILDACCSTRAFWFDKHDPRALFIDNRRETHAIDKGTPGTKGRSPLVINPDQVIDFTDMPFPNESFRLVVFDPPHIERREARGAITKRYGVLSGDWRSMLRAGFSECFRVLKPNGVLVFKWGESSRKIDEILKLTPEKPLFGHKTSKTAHWCVFMKGEPRGWMAKPRTCCESITDEPHAKDCGLVLDDGTDSARLEGHGEPR